MSERFADKLKHWRLASRMKQTTLARMVGVTQGAVSRWERGLDIPSPSVFARLQALMSDQHRDEAIVERLFTARQVSKRALFDLDGLKLLAASRGLSELWPNFSAMVGRRFGTFLINESAALMNDEAFLTSVRRGEIAIVTGVSRRHLSIQTETPDVSILHRWHVRFRKLGAVVLIDAVYERCPEETNVGIEEIIRVYEIEI